MTTAAEAVRAKSLVRRAIQDGSLVRKPCETCGAEKVEAHHDDYSQPLAVRWLCRTHHRRWHVNHPTGIADWPKPKLPVVKGMVSPAEREKLEALASADRRSISQLVRFALVAYMEARAA